MKRPGAQNTTPSEKMVKEDRFICQYLTQLEFFVRHTGEISGNIEKLGDEIPGSLRCKGLVQDELTYGYLRMKGKDKEFSVWWVFAIRILLDLQDILGDQVSQPYKELHDAAKVAKTYLGQRDDHV